MINEDDKTTEAASKRRMDESQFKDNFISTFCATWCAINRQECIDRGWHERLEKPPMEDAIYLADCAWGRWVEATRA
jgi:hypothetical protein